MPAPGHANIIAREGSAGAPANDVDPACGAISATVIADNAVDKIINTPPFDTVAQTYYGGFHYINTATGNLINARAYNRCAMKQNPISGTLTFGFVNGLDSGNKIYVASLVSGLLQSEYITCPAAAGFVQGVKVFDPTVWIFVEFVNTNGLTAVPVGPITVSQTGVTIGVMRGTGSNGSKDLAVRQLYSFVSIATRNTKGLGIAYPNRKTDTADAISAYSRGVRWEGVDESLPIQGNTLNASESVCLGMKVDVPPNLPTPAFGKLQHGVMLVGNAVP